MWRLWACVESCIVKIIAVVGQKGGVGKSTVSVNVAGELVRRGHRVLLVDADPQGSAQEWFVAGEGENWPTVTACSQPIMHRPNQLRAMTEYDYIVIDGPPQRDELTRSALLCADLAILPISPSSLDVRAISRTVGICRDAQAFNEGLRSVLLINRKQAGTIIGRQIRKALQGEGLEDFPLLDNEIHQRVSIAEAPSHGDVIQVYEPDGKATNEFRLLVNELLEELDNE